jgi:hypothetical protein
MEDGDLGAQIWLSFASDMQGEPLWQYGAIAAD